MDRFNLGWYGRAGVNLSCQEKVLLNLIQHMEFISDMTIFDGNVHEYNSWHIFVLLPNMLVVLKIYFPLIHYATNIERD